MNRDIILRVISGSVTTDLDIDSNLPLRVDISSLENDKIGRVFGVGSQTFDLPGTRKNNKFFKNANDVGSIDTPAFNEFLQAYILLDGDVILQGKFFLQEVISSDDGYITYKCQVVDQTVDFKTQLEGKFISQADWSNFTHTMSGDTIQAGWDGDLVNGDIFYPLCDFGSDEVIPFPDLPRIQVDGGANVVGNIDSSNSRMGLQQFQPAISAVSTFDVMFDQAGYNYTSSLITGSQGPFQNLFVMPKSNDELGPVLSGSAQNTIEAGYTASTSPTSIAPDTLLVISASFHEEIEDPGNNYNPVGGAYTAPITGEYTAECFIKTGDCSPTGGFLGTLVTVSLRVYSSGVETQYLQMGSQVFFPTFPAGPASTGGSRTINLNEGDIVIPDIRFYNNSDVFSTNTFSQIDDTDTYFNITVAPVEYDGVDIPMNAQWNSNTKTAEVLKGFIEQFNLVLTPEYSTERTIRVETFDTWMQQGIEVDWTQKYDQSKRVSIKHPISEQNKTILIGNADDNDRFSKIAKDNEPNLQYGTLQIVSDSEVPLGERKITSYFAPIIVGSLIQSGSVTQEGQPTFNLSGNTMFVPHLYKFNNKQETFAFKPRLGYKIDNLNCAPAFNNTIYWGDSNGTLYSGSSYSTLANINTLNASAPIIYNLHFDKSYPDYTAVGGSYITAENLSTTHYELYWNNYIEGLYWDEARKVTLDLEFTPEEYKDIRLNNIIIIKNQKFRINKISGFNLMYPDVVTVELLKEYPVYNNITDIQPIPPATYYYQIQNCNTDNIENTTVTTQSFDPVLPINTRVSGSDGENWKVIGYTTTSGSVITSLVDTGENGCPVPPGPPTCELIEISVASSGDAVELEGICCDGSSAQEQLEDYGAEVYCLVVGSWTVDTFGSTARWRRLGDCDSGCRQGV